MKKFLLFIILFIFSLNHYILAQVGTVRVKMISRYSYTDDYRMNIEINGKKYLSCLRGNAGEDNTSFHEFIDSTANVNLPIKLSVFGFKSRCVYSGDRSNGADCGFSLCSKRLEKGTYEIPFSDTCRMEIKADELLFILKGIKLESVKKRERFYFATK